MEMEPGCSFRANTTGIVLKNLRESKVKTNAARKRRRKNEDFIGLVVEAWKKAKAAHCRSWCSRVIDSRVSIH
jgi:hypothetical protein